MSKKPKCFSEGEEVEFETKQGSNKSITDDVRERAMRAIAAGGQKDEAPVAKKAAPKKAAPKKEAKLPMPDYSNEDLDRMGMNKDIKPVKSSVYSPKSQPESDREENSPWMREFRKDEATAKSSTKANPDLVRKAYVEAAKMQASKPKGMMSGGTVRKSASSRADGCAIRGKTRA